MLCDGDDFDYAVNELRGIFFKCLLWEFDNLYVKELENEEWVGANNLFMLPGMTELLTNLTTAANIFTENVIIPPTEIPKFFAELNSGEDRASLVRRSSHDLERDRDVDVELNLIPNEVES